MTNTHAREMLDLHGARQPFNQHGRARKRIPRRRSWHPAAENRRTRRQRARNREEKRGKGSQAHRGFSRGFSFDGERVTSSDDESSRRRAADGGEERESVTTRIPFPSYEGATTKRSRPAGRAIDGDARTLHELARDLPTRTNNDEKDGGQNL